MSKVLVSLQSALTLTLERLHGYRPIMNKRHRLIHYQCGALARGGALRNKVHMRGTPSFDDSIDSIWSLSARQEPWCVILPESAEDASKVMKVISRHQCPFAVRSGGHSHYGFSNSVEEGIGIDFGTLFFHKYPPRTPLI